MTLFTVLSQHHRFWKGIAFIFNMSGTEEFLDSQRVKYPELAMKYEEIGELHAKK